ncbi:unnamed protein product [Sphagnum troendelagicum]
MPRKSKLPRSVTAGWGRVKTRGSSSWPNADGCAPSPPRFSRTPMRLHFCEFVRIWWSLSAVGGKIFGKRNSVKKEVEGMSLSERETED